MPPDPFTGIPADIQAFRDGWTEITDHGHPYEVVLARDFSDDYLAERICGTFRNMGDKVTSSLVSLGKEVSRASILELLLGDVAIVRLEQFTTEMLVKRNFPPLVPYEYREFLYTRWYRSRFNLSNDKSFSHFMPPLSKSLDIIIMDPHRFATIQSCTRGFSQAGRTGSEDSDVWMEAGAMLRKLNELEVAIFSRSASNLLNHGNGSIVVDDELIASRASDVEQKVVSNRKAGKEGPVADCIACALSSVLLGMRLRVKNDPENVEQLLHTLPLSTASGNDLEVAFDRGYGKLSSVEAIASRNLHVVTVAGTLGSRHPFNTPDEWISTLNKWKTKRELARKKHGSFVNCYYGDAVFNDCVPAANQSQVLHQALVTGFQHGVFVVCKLEEGQGSIVQIVAIRISTEKRDEYAKNLCKVVNPLLGFLHNEDVIARGILMDSDFPDWVTDPQRTILKTRAKLYYGHLKLITTEEGDLRPTKPVSIYKHSTQYRYNKHKPGLDKNTEISDRVAFHTTGPFEAKYVFRMLDAVMVNAWRAYQAVTVISPWLRALGSHPSLAQVRTKLNNFVGVEDFVADVALECLRCLAAQKAIPLFPADVPQEEREERQFKSEFSEYKRKHGWPIRKFALKKFASDPFLNKLRLCTFVDHRPQRIRDVQPVIRENGTSQKVVRRKCVLCFVPGKMIPGTSTIKSKEIANNSTYMCPTCMVVLCKKTVGNSGAKSCHTLWHERHNLEAEGSKCRKRLRVAREMNDDEAQKRKLHATNASIKRHSPAKTSQQTQRSQTQVAINDPQDPQDSFDAVENVVEHVLENLMEMEHGEEHGDEEKEEDKHDFLDMEEYSDGSDEKE
ncbi:hypothetical protein IV203_032960 [Nitzschia inconspicua]|uniref:Uncharacterized protein n=1 Tax=Nitzschia inconspicua TaxID=303405 RepID=A0A9K3KLN7_9STRA|nr:hypothetical protein IV203_032960 [Nitzschia inconspicua]